MYPVAGEDPELQFFRPHTVATAAAAALWFVFGTGPLLTQGGLVMALLLPPPTPRFLAVLLSCNN